MKERIPVFPGRWGIILVIALVLVSLLKPAQSQTIGAALLIQQSPAQGGTITPIPGIHHFALNTQVALIAIPKSGYQFICWLGDVSEPTANRTITYLDKPKIIIAVFEQTEYDTLLREERTPSGSRGGGGSFASGGSTTSTASYSQLGYSSSGGGGSSQQVVLKPTVDDPVPEPSVPEPATGVLLVLGSLFAFARQSTKRQA